MKKICLVLLGVVIAMPLSAQQLDMDLMKGIEPRNIGPAGMSGRITAIDVVEMNPDIMYVGSASGGIWKSESGGIAWEPIFDDYEAASIGAIDIYQKSPSIIWVGTGEGNPRNSASAGAGVYKSLDGGRSWELMGLEGTRNIHRVIIHPDDPNTVYVGAQGNAWADTEDRGVYKTIDGGKTWEKILYTNTRTGIADLVMDPINPNKMFAAMWEYRRWPWFFESGGEGSGLYMTVDGGENWKELTSEDGLPEGELGKIGVAIAPNKPNVVYALVESKKNAIYRSDDGGYTWELRQTVEDDPQVGNRPFYYHEIYVDPFNENRVYSIYTFISKSEDGARSFESLYPYYNWVHPDHHAFWLSKTSPGFMIDGNDGGLNITFDGGDTWRFIENIPVGQFYHVNVDMEIPYNVYGGMQDNGSWEGPAYVWRAGGIRNAYWDELFFGDGFDVLIDPSDSRYAYAMSQQGNIGRVDRETGSARFVRPTHPDGENLRFNWNAALNFDPFDEETIYFGSQYVHKSTDRGETWAIISPDLTTNDTTKQKQYESGGLTMDATGAENYTTILAIEPSPVEEGVIWAGTDDGKVQITRDGGETWNDVSGNLRGVPEGSYVAQVKASKFNAGEAIAVINDYRRGNWTPYVMHTTDYGRRWRNIVQDKGLNGYALSFVQDLEEPNLMFVGTELGLYVTIDGGSSWTKWTNEYPTVSTYDMVIHPREHDLVIGTFGRSFWVMDDIRPLRELAANGADELEKAIKAFPSPDAYLAEWRQAMGSRFTADGFFMGDNRPNGAMLTYSVNVPEPEEGEEKKEEKVKIEVFDASGEKIRTLEETPDHNGINRTRWGLDRKGVRNPSRNATRPEASEPGGADVLPGTYKVKFTYMESSDSTMVTVHTDPRIEMPMNALQATSNFIDRVNEVRQDLSDAVAKLREAKEIIELNERLIKSDSRSKEELEEVNEITKATKEKVDGLMNHVFGEPDERQGITSNPTVTVMNRLFGPLRYLGGDFDGPGATEENLLRLAKEAVDEAVSEIEHFVSTDWATYQTAIEAADLSPFKILGEDN
ncbi:MAG: hypothetical protein JJ971_01525 [Balneolaceae bacterium]|nr:hypothetical protein [Balneolaceae bacterium]MBO6545052.1 hypothetical protein [Balneolaceae bacterium]MBO6646448.1 hypothetical protein [Balneolaceae bacterium]